MVSRVNRMLDLITVRSPDQRSNQITIRSPEQLLRLLPLSPQNNFDKMELFSLSYFIVFIILIIYPELFGFYFIFILILLLLLLLLLLFYKNIHSRENGTE